MAAMLLLVYDVGYRPFYSNGGFIHAAMLTLLFILRLAFFLRFIFQWVEPRKLRVRLYHGTMVILVFYLYQQFYQLLQDAPPYEDVFLYRKVFVYTCIGFFFTAEVSYLLRFIYRKSVNPAFLFVLSFAFLIAVGSVLLLLPNATVNGIDPVDALFTSASAVCVTGLIVVDTATHFTTLGQTIILVLIQIGGLGIMTFTGLLSYIAFGSVSFQNQLALKDMLSSDRIGNVITLVIRIVMVTLFFELIGAVLIHASLGDTLFDNTPEKIYFSVFHAVSAFCNAGFSTLTNGLYELPIRYNYTLQLCIAILVILGGMGFPIVLNIFTFLRVKVQNLFYALFNVPSKETYTHILHLNSRLALTTSAVLLLIGFLTYFIFEANNTLLSHPTWYGKTVTSFFGSVTPRTAGFNTVEISALTLPMIMVYLLLMWIGASPGSTGGGIKTTTAAVAFLNAGSVIKGKDRTEVFKAQVSERSINRAFAIMLISLLIIGFTVLLITYYDGHHGVMKIAFETFSAFSTVGLTLGITPELSHASKIILVFVMFIGRVGALMVLFSFVPAVRQLYYRYPTEDILF